MRPVGFGYVAFQGEEFIGDLLIQGSAPFSFATQPKQAIDNEAVLGFASQSGRQLFVGLVLVINIVVTHVEIDHSIPVISPGDGVVTIVPGLMRFGSGSERETGWVNRKQDRDVGVGSQIIAPFVPFTG